VRPARPTHVHPYILSGPTPSSKLRYISHSTVFPARWPLECRDATRPYSLLSRTLLRPRNRFPPLQNEISLALPERGYGGLGQIELRIAPAAYFLTGARRLARHRDSNSFYQSISMRDGSTYLHWHGVGEFLISPDGGRITGRRHDRVHAESFQAYLLGQALSYALVKRSVGTSGMSCPRANSR
jgi:hypothetical protein